MKKARDIELTPEELEGLMQRLDAGALTAEDHEIIKTIIETFLVLNQAVQDKNGKINKLLKMIFGVKTEKADKVLGSSDRQGKAGNEKCQGEKTSDSEENAEEKAKGHGKKGTTEYTGAEKITVSHTELNPGDNCLLCPNGKIYSWTPGKVVRFTGAAPLEAKVWELEKLRCNLCGAIFTADMPEEAGAEKYDETSGAMIALLRYGSGLPFTRLEQLQESMGNPLPASTQWDIVEKVADRIYPVFEELIREAAQGDVIHNDDTTMKILDLTNDEDRKGCFTTGILARVEGRKVVVFFTGRKHAGENMSTLLQQRETGLSLPIQMCDALSRNIPKEFETILANCLVHARRKFVDVIESFPDECRVVIEALALIYKNDTAAKKQNMTPEARLVWHKTESAPVMEQLHVWLKDQFDNKKAEPNSGLGKAISYMLKHWEPLTLFLRVAGAPLDNNLCEQALKRAILHRKNSLFYRTSHGAYIGDLFMSLIHTCKMTQINPFDYLVALQRNSTAVFRTPHNWLPWQYKAALSESFL